MEIEGSYNYGKFTDSTYPFLNWEPSDQKVIRNFILFNLVDFRLLTNLFFKKYILLAADYYLDKGIMHAPGFKYAINTDIVQFQVFSGSRSALAWNYCLPSLHGGNGIVVSLSESNLMFLVSYYNATTSKPNQQFALLMASEKYGPISVFQFETNHPSSSFASDISVSKISDQQYEVLVWTPSSNYYVYLLNLQDTMELLLRYSGKF